MAQQDEAQEKANRVRERLVAGESFAAVATEVGTSSKGAVIGPIKLDEINPAIKDILNNLKIGEVSSVLPVTGGYQILKLESRSESKIRTVQEARGDVFRRIAEQKSRGERLKYLEQLRQQANIEWRQDELKRAYEKALAERRDAVTRGEIPLRS